MARILTGTLTLASGIVARHHAHVDFDFDADQKALRDAVNTTLARALPHDRLREIVDAHGTLPPDLWAQFAELGWTGLLIPDEYGGLGMGLVDMCVVMEEMGKLPLPGPFFSSAVLATLAAKALGLTDVLPALANGESRGTVAIEEIGTASDVLADVATRASKGDDGSYRLDGLKPTVLDGEGADWVLVVARDDAGVAAYLIDKPEATTVPAMDPTRQLARLELVSTPARRVGPEGDQSELLRRVLDDAAVMLCAELVGACDAAFDLAAEYSKSRVQFGRPIGTFQAIKHIAADMLQALTLARVGTHKAAWASDVDAPDREVCAAMAKAWVAEAAVHVTSDTIQIHGGVGFTWESDAHLYYKRAKANDLMLGRQGWQRRRVADLILGPVA
jgi:alkylation response protein AidB-like acyl-CoA dehydrogenase